VLFLKNLPNDSEKKIQGTVQCCSVVFQDTFKQFQISVCSLFDVEHWSQIQLKMRQFNQWTAFAPIDCTISPILWMTNN
jgi:hypothetical protein